MNHQFTMHGSDDNSTNTNQNDEDLDLLVHLDLPPWKDFRPQGVRIPLKCSPEECSNAVQLHRLVERNLTARPGEQTQLPPLPKISIYVQDRHNQAFGCNEEKCAALVRVDLDLQPDLDELDQTTKAWLGESKRREFSWKKRFLTGLIIGAEVNSIDLRAVSSVVHSLSPEEITCLHSTLASFARTVLLAVGSEDAFKHASVEMRMELSCVLAIVLANVQVDDGIMYVDVLLSLLRQSSSILSACPAKPYVNLLGCIVFVLRRSRLCEIRSVRSGLRYGGVVAFLVRCLRHAASEEVLFLSLLGVDAVMDSLATEQMHQVGPALLGLVRCPILLLKDRMKRHSLRTVAMAVYLLDYIFDASPFLTTSRRWNGLDLHFICKLLESALSFVSIPTPADVHDTEAKQNEEIHISLRALSLTNRLLNMTVLDMSIVMNEDLLPLNLFFVQLADLISFARRATRQDDNTSDAYPTLEALALYAIRAIVIAQPQRVPDLAQMDGRLRHVVSLNQCLSSSGRQACCLILLASKGEDVVRCGLIELEEVLIHMESAPSRSYEKELLAEVVAVLMNHQTTVNLSCLSLIACVIEQSVSHNVRTVSLLCRAMGSGLKLQMLRDVADAAEKKTEDDLEDSEDVELHLHERSMACLMKILACFHKNGDTGSSLAPSSLDMLHALKSLCRLLTLPNAAESFVSTGGVEFLLGLAKATWEQHPHICIKVLTVLRCIASKDICAHAMAKPELLESLFAFATRKERSETETSGATNSSTIHPRVSRLAASLLLALPFPFELSETCYIALVKTFLFLPPGSVAGHIFGAKIFAKINFSPLGYKILRQQRCIARLIKFACSQDDAGLTVESPESSEFDAALQTSEDQDKNLRRSHALLALAYCAKDKINQVYLAQRALDKLLIVVWTSDARYDHELIGLILAQVNSHKANRTRIYKAEMKARELCHFHETARSRSRAKTPQRSINQLPEDCSIAAKEEFQKAVLQHAKPFLDVSANPSLAVKSNQMENANTHSLVHKLRLSTKMMWKRLESATDSMHNHAPSWDQPIYKDRIFEASKAIPRPRCYADLEPEELLLEVLNDHTREEIQGVPDGWQKIIDGIKQLECSVVWTKHRSNDRLLESILKGSSQLKPMTIEKQPMLVVLRERSEDSMGGAKD